MKTERKYNILAQVGVSVLASTKKEAVEKAKIALEFLDIYSAKVIEDDRTHQQNNSLHLMFSQLSKECLEKGIEMRQLVREEVPIPCTTTNLKWLWKLLQEALFKTESTTKLKKTGQIDIVWDAFNKILIEKTQGQISLPPFPSLENQVKESKLDYPTENYEPIF